MYYRTTSMVFVTAAGKSNFAVFLRVAEFSLVHFSFETRRGLFVFARQVGVLVRFIGVSGVSFSGKARSRLANLCHTRHWRYNPATRSKSGFTSKRLPSTRWARAARSIAAPSPSAASTSSRARAAFRATCLRVGLAGAG